MPLPTDLEFLRQLRAIGEAIAELRAERDDTRRRMLMIEGRMTSLQGILSLQATQLEDARTRIRNLERRDYVLTQPPSAIPEPVPSEDAA